MGLAEAYGCLFREQAARLERVRSQVQARMDCILRQHAFFCFAARFQFANVSVCVFPSVCTRRTYTTFCFTNRSRLVNTYEFMFCQRDALCDRVRIEILQFCCALRKGMSLSLANRPRRSNRCKLRFGERVAHYGNI